jgi:hypothetical protein
MRKFAWATPKAIARLTDRQIHDLCFMPTDDEGNLLPFGTEAEQAAADEPPPPPKGSREEFEQFMGLNEAFGVPKEVALAKWAEKRGPVPGGDDGKGKG